MTCLVDSSLATYLVDSSLVTCQPVLVLFQSHLFSGNTDPNRVLVEDLGADPLADLGFAPAAAASSTFVDGAGRDVGHSGPEIVFPQNNILQRTPPPRSSPPVQPVTPTRSTATSEEERQPVLLTTFGLGAKPQSRPSPVKKGSTVKRMATPRSGSNSVSLGQRRASVAAHRLRSASKDRAAVMASVPKLGPDEMPYQCGCLKLCKGNCGCIRRGLPCHPACRCHCPSKGRTSSAKK